MTDWQAVYVQWQSSQWNKMAPLALLSHCWQFGRGFPGNTNLLSRWAHETRDGDVITQQPPHQRSRLTSLIWCFHQSSARRRQRVRLYRATQSRLSVSHWRSGEKHKSEAMFGLYTDIKDDEWDHFLTLFFPSGNHFCNNRGQRLE